MAFESLKAHLGIGGRHRRYVDIESVRDLEDISDPETVEDESSHGFRDWASEHPILAVIVSILGVLIVGIVLFWTSRIAPGILTNPMVWKGAVVLTIFGSGYRFGWKNHRQRVSDWDELEIKRGDDVVSFKGVYLDDLPSDADGFIPIKGWRAGGHKAVPYKNGELGAAMSESYNPYEMADDEAAVIRMKPGETAVTHTDWGTRVVQRSGGLRPDPQGNHTTLVAELPDYDDKRANDLASQLEQVTKDYYDAQGEIQGLQRRISNLKDRLNEPIDDEVQKRIREFRDMREAVDGRHSQESDSSRDSVGPRPQQHDFRGTGTMTNGHSKSEIEEVDEELTNDD